MATMTEKVEHYMELMRFGTSVQTIIYWQFMWVEHMGDEMRIWNGKDATESAWARLNVLLKPSFLKYSYIVEDQQETCWLF